MTLRRNLYVAGGVAASSSYLFNVLAFTGSFDLFRGFVFISLFLVVMAGFEKFIEWAETLEE
ncbi:MAG: hypothetical protein ACI8Z7_000945 [Candidatus Nanohaloarchaea archaeon]|jgi:hypothetical protein